MGGNPPPERWEPFSPSCMGIALPPAIIDPIGHVTQIHFPQRWQAGRLPQFPCLSCFYGNPAPTVLAEKPWSRQPLRSPSSFLHWKRRTWNLPRSWGEAGTKSRVTRRSVGLGWASLSRPRRRRLLAGRALLRGNSRCAPCGWVLPTGMSRCLCYVSPRFQACCAVGLRVGVTGRSLNTTHHHWELASS